MGRTSKAKSLPAPFPNNHHAKAITQKAQKFLRNFGYLSHVSGLSALRGYKKAQGLAEIDAALSSFKTSSEDNTSLNRTLYIMA